MRRFAVAQALVVVLACAGCGRSAPAVPRETETLGPLPTLSAAEAAQLVGLPWTADPIRPTDQQFLIDVADVRCYELAGVNLGTTTTNITVSVLGRRVECRAGKISAAALVRLPEPVGSRRLIHAPTR
ncbi:hypothetical protein U2F26_16810 [Micromonospora sp. 4G57]|uniref:DUF4333 domain-containing protein n=1 Tax=Micromonospora sicca TaxID=2202420 RepID=A0ABU5JB22_9ACTN|nr:MULTISPECIES: hypothetical protein [unclassified Micromonospora]MDZ5444383.1 hypothetical protein [Micromonospora sp. 4G57]MDZ5489783.1 hypothetical protein [Micromonospora sp. 4G53]